MILMPKENGTFNSLLGSDQYSLGMGDWVWVTSFLFIFSKLLALQRRGWQYPGVILKYPVIPEFFMSVSPKIMYSLLPIMLMSLQVKQKLLDMQLRK